MIYFADSSEVITPVRQFTESISFFLGALATCVRMTDDIP
jgi:hypothetical protein